MQKGNHFSKSTFLSLCVKKWKIRAISFPVQLWFLSQTGLHNINGKLVLIWCWCVCSVECIAGWRTSILSDCKLSIYGKFYTIWDFVYCNNIPAHTHFEKGYSLCTKVTEILLIVCLSNWKRWKTISGI